ncbi:50S ribosomal protein L9 [bacterium]|nr:50S ribosomal protein L9 [bacterium]
MKVILLRDVSGIGQKGTVQNVSDGHALNFLIPNRLAEMATADKVKALEKQKATDAEAAAARDTEWRNLAKQLKDARVEIKANASEQGHLYEKISNIQVSKAIIDQLKFAVPPASIEPKMAIKEVGEWPVAITLGNHQATLIVVVARS